MKRFTVTLTRDTSESLVVDVEASDDATAFNAAMKLAREKDANWEQDDWASKPYLGDPENGIELIEEINPNPPKARMSPSITEIARMQIGDKIVVLADRGDGAIIDRYVTWRLDEEGNCFWGHYFPTHNEALLDFISR